MGTWSEVLKGGHLAYRDAKLLLGGQRSPPCSPHYCVCCMLVHAADGGATSRENRPPDRPSTGQQANGVQAAMHTIAGVGHPAPSSASTYIIIIEACFAPPARTTIHSYPVPWAKGKQNADHWLPHRRQSVGPHWTNFLPPAISLPFPAGMDPCRPLTYPDRPSGRPL